MPKRSNKDVASVAVSTVKQEEDGEKGFSLPVQLTKKQCVDSFVESVNDSADKNGVFWYKHATCAICMDPIDKPSSGVVLDCKHHPFHASCIVKSLQRDRRCPVCRHAPASRADESIQEVADGEGSLIADFESDSGIDSDDEEDEYEHYEKLVTTRLLVGLDLETLNHCLVCYNCDPQRRRRVAAKELARQLLQETDSEDSE